MVRPRVFVTQPVPGHALARLGEVAEVDVLPDASRIAPREELALPPNVANLDVFV
jgi:hypothetical protein